MHYLVIDKRFTQSPVYVFLETDPRAEDEFPNLPVYCVTLSRLIGGLSTPAAIGQNTIDISQFEEFQSDKAVAQARHELIEPRYVGPTWKSYSRAFRFGA